MGSIAETITANRSSTTTPSMFSLSNRTVAITGGGRGLGITLAAAVLESGGHAACIDILPIPSEPEWSGLLALAKSSNLTLTYHTCDITSEPSISAVLDLIASNGTAAGAPLSGTVACAGIQQKVPAVEYPVDGFRRIMDVNVTGTFLTIKHSARIFMREKTRGSVVMIASMSGQVANRVCESLFLLFSDTCDRGMLIICHANRG
jgi:NAD(P)-dependent dehydrogenase (short-subunit alcohol dehydrogenase family)